MHILFISERIMFLLPDLYPTMADPILNANTPFYLTCAVNNSSQYKATSVYFTVIKGRGNTENVNKNLIKVDVVANIAELWHPGLEAPPKGIEIIWICCWLKEIRGDLGCWALRIGCMSFIQC